jgi:phage head-tail adaptor, putative, SPP1 family
MDPGQLRHPITIERDAGETTNTLGQKVRDWQPIPGGSKCWAKVEPLSNRELLLAQQTNSTITHRLTIRYRSDVTSRMRVVFGERVFYLEGVRNLEERNVWLELTAREDV